MLHYTDWHQLAGRQGPIFSYFSQHTPIFLTFKFVLLTFKFAMSADIRYRSNVM